MAETTDDGAGHDADGNKIAVDDAASIGHGDNGGTNGVTGSIDPANAVRETGSGFDINADGFNVSAALDTGGGKRGRGRPKGSGTTKKKGPLDISGVEKILLSLHAMAAAATHTPELELDKDEANKLAVAGSEVAAHYAVNVDPKILAWINFGAALGMIYGTRIIAINARKGREKRKPPADKDDTNVVMEFPGTGKLPEFKA